MAMGLHHSLFKSRESIEGTLCSIRSTSGKKTEGTIDREKSKILSVCIKMYELGRTVFFHTHKKLILIVRAYAASYMQNVAVH